VRFPDPAFFLPDPVRKDFSCSGTVFRRNLERGMSRKLSNTQEQDDRGRDGGV
jgi:hypothetical protein